VRERLLVALNFSNGARRVELPARLLARPLLSTRLDRDASWLLRVIDLRPREGLVLRFEGVETRAETSAETSAEA
jgi:hypothetical protein